MSMIGKKLGNAKKHNGKIMEHNRFRPIAETLSHPRLIFSAPQNAQTQNGHLQA